MRRCDGATATREADHGQPRDAAIGRCCPAACIRPREVIETHGKFTGFSRRRAVMPRARKTSPLIDKTSRAVVQNPSFFGHVHDLSALAKACHDAGALLVVAVTEIVSLGLVTPPGEMGADIVTAEGQSLGVPLSFGGPYVGLFTTRDKFIRQMPGRLTGQTVDVDGKRGWVLTLSTREQHIRREKATSNICTIRPGALAFNIHSHCLARRAHQARALAMPRRHASLIA
jgi:glycine dehydrogenase subunit 1